MMQNLNKNLYDPKFGNWSYLNQNIDPYCDYGGGDRIEEYTSVLLKNLKNHKSFADSVYIANNFFTSLYGKDKLYKNVKNSNSKIKL